MKQYILALTAAGTVCAIARQFGGEKGFSGRMIRVVCGIFMAITLLSPLGDFSVSSLLDALPDYESAGQAAAADGKEMADDALRELIISQTRTYILDEAEKMGLDLDVEVTLSDSDPPIPAQVILTGEISPYKKKQLSQMLSQTLGIGQEAQLWM